MQVKNKTIIITDPCYIIKKNHEKNPYPYPNRAELINDPNWEQMKEDYRNWEAEHDDWIKCHYSENMEALGITNYISRSTIYGDWSCTTYNSNTQEAIGKFCADAGLVAVFELDEVRAYNSEIDKWIEEHPWCVTVIKNFTGKVHFEVVHHKGVYTKEDEFEIDGKIYCKENTPWEEDEVQVVGKGTINFYTTQTGL